jgi:two-component system nitrogen regulation response regulator GlnG
VRELVNLCRRLTVLAPGTEIHADDLPAEMSQAQDGGADVDWSRALEAWAERRTAQDGPWLETAAPEFERTLIRVALRRSQGHRQDAAKLLGLGRNTLTRKLKELGMGADDELL